MLFLLRLDVWYGEYIVPYNVAIALETAGRRELTNHTKIWALAHEMGRILGLFTQSELKKPHLHPFNSNVRDCTTS